jgi:UDP-4-amino-4,6-dideoxy-N-acetyl-beta-L-altrosamine transaminase
MCDVKHESAKPAIAGGTPVRRVLLPYGHQSIGRDDIDQVIAVLQSEWLTTGPRVAEFEEAFAASVGVKHAVSFSSGTAALHGAVFAAKLGPGDEAVTTPMTFVATANCVIYQGAKPVFADVRSDTLNINPAKIEARLGPKAKAVIPVDYAGHPCDLEAIWKIAEDRGLIVIEDACHALGAEYKGKRVGSISNLTVFSFHPVKHVTTGEGGMVVTNSDQMAADLKSFRNHGIRSDARQRQAAGNWVYDMEALGWNYRLTDIACALGLSQLRRLTANVARRREIASRYQEAFQDLPLTLPFVSPEAKPSWHLFPIRLKLEQLRAGRGELFQALRAENIGVNVHYIPVHVHSYYRSVLGHRAGECPVAEAEYERLISLPMFHGMSDQDVEDVIAAVGKVLTFYRRCDE